MTVLVLAQHDHASLDKATLHALTAALQLGGDVHVLVAGSGAATAAAQAAMRAGRGAGAAC